MALDPELLPRLRDRLVALLETGGIVPVVGARFPLEGAADALRALEERRAVGKLVLEVSA
jgi:NADPH2:quinone reductase